jgi:hypothetical protein
MKKRPQPLSISLIGQALHTFVLRHRLLAGVYESVQRKLAFVPLINGACSLFGVGRRTVSR